MLAIYIIVALIILYFLLFFGFGWYLSTPGYQGPKTDHFDGKKFINPGNVQSNGFKEVIKYMLSDSRGIWTEVISKKKRKAPDSAHGDEVIVTFINHSTFLIQCKGVNILTDPVWSKRCSPFQWAGPKRFHQPGLALDNLPKIDVVLLSHNHYDHLDLETLKKIQKVHQPQFVVPLGVDLFLNKKGIACKAVLDWWGETVVAGNLRIKSTPAQHFSSRGLFDKDRSLWCGYGIGIENEWLWFAGDSGYGPFFKDIGRELSPLRASIIPIGAFKPRWFMQPIHMSPPEAIQAHEDVNSPYSIACHFGTFPLAKDGMDEPVNELLICLNDPDKSEIKFIVPRPGKSISVPTRGEHK
jgi:L-ascorbate metabolism protein UlaG (beta-lactamase superfamily)